MPSLSRFAPYLSLLVFVGCATAPVTETTSAKLTYWTEHVRIELPVSGPVPSVLSRYLKQDSLLVDYPMDDISLHLTVVREPLEGNTDLADLQFRGARQLDPYRIKQGLEASVFAYDLHDFPEPNTRNCSVSRIYLFTVEKSLYTVSFNAKQDVPLESPTWPENCTVLSDAGHQRFMNFVTSAMETFRIDEPS